MNIIETLKGEIERVTLKGNADKVTVQRLSAILWELEQRVKKLEDDAAAAIEKQKRGRGRPPKEEE